MLQFDYICQKDVLIQFDVIAQPEDFFCDFT